MSGRSNGGRTRILDLEAARRSSRKRERETLSPDEASILIDSVFLRYGMDPTLWTDFSGWRHIMIGSAEGFAGVVEWQPDDHYLVVLAPILDLPQEEDQLQHIYKMLLELNYHGTLSAHFSINDNTLYLGITRPIRGLDEEEVDEAIRTVMILADSYDDRLKELIQIIPPSLPQLPDIRLRRKDAQIIGLTLAACDDHGQAIFRHLMETWEAFGYIVEAGTAGVALSFMLNDQPYALAALHPGFAERKQEIILSWGGLQRKVEFSVEAIQSFQSEIIDFVDIKTTANTGHIEVTDSFSLEMASTLIDVMDRFARRVVSSWEEIGTTIEEEEFDRFMIQTDPATLLRITETLNQCQTASRRIFESIIRGWQEVGGELECKTVGRIYLKMETGEHPYGEYGVLSHKINLAVLVVPQIVESPRIELAWNLASGQFAYLAFAAQEVHDYESIVSSLPGYSERVNQKMIVLEYGFQEEHCIELLNALIALRSATMARPEKS